MEHPELSSLKSLLQAGRIIALVLWILGAIWVLGAIAAAAFASAFGYYGSILGIIYPVLFTIVTLLTWMRVPEIESQVAQGQYRPARDATLLWMILGWFFGVINGIILLLAFLKFDTVIATGGVAAAPPANYMPPVGGMPPGYAAPAPQLGYAQPAPQAPYSQSAPQAGYAAPAPMAPPLAPMAPPAAAGTTPCPRCGRPLTWIPQYSRWYCYSDSQYA